MADQHQLVSMSSIFELVSPDLVTSEVISCYESLDTDSRQEYCQLASLLVAYLRAERIQCLGLSGGQGSGKSTLGRLIQQAGAWYGELIAVLSLDDFYLTQTERKMLASEHHPLLETRGPPGTHDSNRLRTVIKDLKQGRGSLVPVFDKARDDRMGERQIQEGQDRIVLEGWCVGARPQNKNQLISPVNELERKHDEDRAWRTWVNNKLEEDYSPLWALLDRVVYLSVYDLDSVRRWRYQQEKDIPLQQQRSEEWVAQFIQYYQRITEAMRQHPEQFANMIVDLGQEHQVTGVRFL